MNMIDIIREWKFFWMKEYNSSRGVDSNMMHDLAKRLKGPECSLIDIVGAYNRFYDKTGKNRFELFELLPYIKPRRRTKAKVAKVAG